MKSLLTRVAGVMLLASVILVAHQMKIGSLSAPLIVCYMGALGGAVLVARGIRSHWIAGAVTFGALMITALGIRFT